MEDVARAWESGAQSMVLRSYELASWSFDHEVGMRFATTKYSDGVIHHGDVPIEMTYVDQITDDGELITSWWDEHEIFTGPISNNSGIIARTADQVVTFKGRTYTYADRAAFLAAWRRKYPAGPSGYKPPTIHPALKTAGGGAVPHPAQQ